MPIMSDWQILGPAERRARGLPLGSRADSDQRVRALFGECVAEIQNGPLLAPAVSYEMLPAEEIGRDHILLSCGARLEGVSRLAADLSKARSVVAVVATIGAGLEARVQRLFAEGNRLRALLLEELGTAALFELSERMERRIENAVCTGADRLSCPYQPGEGEFPLAYQRDVCALAGAERAGVRISGAGMLDPVKSMSLLFGVGPKVPRRVGYDRCAACRVRDRCRYRHDAGRELAA